VNIFHLTCKVCFFMIIYFGPISILMQLRKMAIVASDHGPSCDGPSDNTVQSRVEAAKLSCHGEP
jgi:hypothetical protein